jgi:cytidine deaminase
MNDISKEELMKQATGAMRNAYTPYSGLRVGAALETGDGTVYTGANIENSSYGLSICAERVALFKAVSEGKTGFKRMALASDGTATIVPCGACLQVLAELSPDLQVITKDADGNIQEKALDSYLPEAFKIFEG